MEKKKNILTPFEFPPVLKELYDYRLNKFKKRTKVPKTNRENVYENKCFIENP